MHITSYKGKTPKIAETALIADTACILGDVEIGENTSIWPGVVIRGDAAAIRIGNNCHIEDNSVVHGQVTVGDNTMIAHNCTVEGCIGSNVLIGNGACVLVTAEIGDDSLVAAGSVVLEGTIVPPKSFVLGVPAKVRGELTQHNIERKQFFMPYYTGLVEEYKKQGIWSSKKSGDEK